MGKGKAVTKDWMVHQRSHEIMKGCACQKCVAKSKPLLMIAPFLSPCLGEMLA